MGNKQTTSMLGQIGNYSPLPSDINAVIDAQSQRAGSPYFSPTHIVTATIGPFGVPYQMQPIAIQTCTNMYISAPEPWQKSMIFHGVNTGYTAGQWGNGSAPNKGVFTGVEDCG